MATKKSKSLILYIKDMDPVEVRYTDDNTEVVVMLLTAIHLNQGTFDDETMFIGLGKNNESGLFFQRSHLASIETKPFVSDEILNQVKENLQRLPTLNTDSMDAPIAFTETWKKWVWKNIEIGYNKDSLFQALLDHGFSHATIRSELLHEFNSKNVDSEQLKKLTAPHSSQIFLPNAKRVENHLAEIYTLENFLNPGECKKLIKLIKSDMERSRVSGKESEQLNEARTSSTCYFRDRENKHAIATEIEDRISRLMGINLSHNEGLQGQYYEVGQEFKAHSDWFAPGSETYEQQHIEGQKGQRTWTFLVYLNDEDLEGGGTHFNSLGIEIQPKQGMAIVWNNLYPDDQPNQYTMHQGLPVKKGFKAILNLWFRAKGDGNPVYTKQDGEYLSNYTVDGIKKTKVPPKLFTQIKKYYKDNKDDQSLVVIEDPSSHVTKQDDDGSTGTASEVITMTEQFRDYVHNELKSVCEKWCGQKLIPTIVYGIRRYKTGAQLPVHLDWPETHVISAILCVDQDKNQKWPLLVGDNHYRWNQVLMKPGDMLLYEGARCLHGRPMPLDGKYHCNLYVHYKPENHVVNIPNREEPGSDLRV